ncbi:Ubiquitin-conjugating enzyme E2 J1 [Desmophyllum pertusum]|uniref:Ubiquitin-conjugating enzyme E2 J1 n=1 Tax=Desmophyllum pertusum TaxID=174260 RepID=A0A9X0CLK7_9CNID|nr:Ubiquitin-conjugating enzyme E2 J1 [Desmophyllum pertusum]
MEAKYNLRSPGVKRLMREAKELNQPTELYFAQPLEDNLFEWHFTVRGPPDSDFAGGRYHGRITLPPEYPMKPPSIMLLTPNGRFEVGKKICLSMSAHHPETWQPSWSIRTVLMALIGFMPTQGAGAIGSLDYTTQERKVLAKRSLDWKCNGCDVCMKTTLPEATGESSKEAEKEAAELAAQITFKGENEKEKPSEGTAAAPSSTATSQPQASTTESVSMASSQMGASPMGVPPQYYASYQSQYPYYATGYPMYNMMNTNPLAAQGYQNNAAPSTVLPNQTETVPIPANQNAGEGGAASSVRQRTAANHSTAGQSTPQPVGHASQTNSVIQTQPRITQNSMASLIVLWVLAVSIVALVCRRLLMIS